MFFALGCAGLVFFSLQATCAGVIGGKLTHRVRRMALAAALRQEIGFYDDERNSSGTLCARLENDAAHIKVLVGDGLVLSKPVADSFFFFFKGVLWVRSLRIFRCEVPAFHLSTDSEYVFSLFIAPPILIPPVWQNLSTVTAALTISLIYGWRLALLILATFPLTLAGAYFQIRVHNGLTGDTREMYEASSQVAMDAVSNARTVAAFVADDRVLRLFESFLVIPKQKSHQSAVLGGVAYGLSQFLQLSPYSLAFWYAGTEVAAGKLSFKAIMIVFFSITMGAIGMSNSFAGLSDVGNAQQAAASVFELIDRKPAIDATSEDGLKPETVRGDIELRNVDFVYPNRPNVQIFKDFSLVVPAGKVMALVGESGSGKSTVVSLVERFYDPVAGAVFLDGTNIKDLNLRWLRRHVGLVSQEPALFATTIKDNILYGKEDATDAEVDAAIHAANVANFVLRLPDGLDTQVGERGLQMSGGQKQRIAIARAVLKDPRILLLDEATSALDTESERIVQNALDRLMVGRTTVVVAHRLSTIRNAHCISVVRHGAVVESGAHDELVARGGAYAALMSVRGAEEVDEPVGFVGGPAPNEAGFESRPGVRAAGEVEDDE